MFNLISLDVLCVKQRMITINSLDQHFVQTKLRQKYYVTFRVLNQCAAVVFSGPRNQYLCRNSRAN